MVQNRNYNYLSITEVNRLHLHAQQRENERMSRYRHHAEKFLNTLNP